MNHSVRELAWAFESPGLLADSNELVESDEFLISLIEPYRPALVALEQNPAELKDFLASIEMHRRLGRYLETLLQFYFVKLARASRIASNLQIRRGKQTLGELDLIFQLNADETPRHWETSVKFYLCIAEEADEALDEKYFLGTLVWDRLDRKIEKLLGKQLLLAREPESVAVLNQLGFQTPIDRALLKGYLYYPSHKDWQTHVHPISISKDHMRGWWTTSGRMDFPEHSKESRYFLLPQARWLTPYQGYVSPAQILTRAQLEEVTKNYFGGVTDEKALQKEIMISEIQILDEKDGEQLVREISRGNILHAEWPTMARASVL